MVVGHHVGHFLEGLVSLRMLAYAAAVLCRPVGNENTDPSIDIVMLQFPQLRTHFIDVPPWRTLTRDDNVNEENNTPKDVAHLVSFRVPRIVSVHPMTVIRFLLRHSTEIVHTLPTLTPVSDHLPASLQNSRSFLASIIDMVCQIAGTLQVLL